MFWQYGLSLFIVLLLLVITVMNMRTSIISNKLLLALVIMFFPLILLYDPGQITVRLAAALIVFSIALFLLRFGNFGAGGLKLIVVMSLYLTPKQSGIAMLITCLIIGVLYIIKHFRKDAEDIVVPLAPILTISAIGGICLDFILSR